MDKYTTIKNIFEKKTDAEKAKAMSKYMRNQFSFYGIPAPERKKLYKDFLKKEIKNAVIDWAFLDLCYADPHREFQYLVYDYLIKFNNCLVYEDVSKLKKYIQTKSWWDTVDFFDKIIGRIGLKDDRINTLMRIWSQDCDFWVRRVAIDHQLGRKEKTDTELLEAVITNNFGSDEFFINKAIGWSLRDYSKTNPDWVRQFIEKYKDKMHKLSIREASKYL